jgi:Putative enzyme of poly-gamma-glutamate biosynthesis (capsule formation)
MCNLETTIGQYKNLAYSGYPSFNAPETLPVALAASGYDMVSLANNHMLDRWGDGLINTVNNVEAAGLAHVGAYRSAEERSTPVVVKVNGVRIGFVAYTRYANRKERDSDPEIVSYGVPFFYNADLEGDIRALREAGAEVVVAYAHWGAEYTHEPSDKQRNYANDLIAAGADIIIGGHPHMLHPMETVTAKDKSGNTKSAFVVWSIGDFLSSYTARYTNAGIILDLTLKERSDGTFDVINIGYVPTYSWVHDSTVQVLPIGKALKNRPKGMSDEIFKDMKRAYEDTTTLMGAEYKVLDA